MYVNKPKNTGFTLIELMVVMSIVALLMGLVGSLAINSLEKAQAKQEMLSLKNWFRKVGVRAFYAGQAHVVKLTGKQVSLFIVGQEQQALESISLEALFFQPQVLNYSAKGFVEPNKITGTYRGVELDLDLSILVNGVEVETVE
jgi:prepilin-type N-terminal cleavage/methylation domain-containing protein